MWRINYLFADVGPNIRITLKSNNENENKKVEKVEESKKNSLEYIFESK